MWNTSADRTWFASLEMGELAQVAAAFVHGRHQQLVTCEYSIRRLPSSWNYLVAAGLAPLLKLFQEFRLADVSVDFLRHHPAFACIPVAWFDHLRELRFAGDVWAMPEGTHFFPASPVLRITAPFETAVLLRGLVQGVLTHAISVATTSSRMLSVAQGRMLIEVRSTGTGSTDDRLATTRAAYLAGVHTTTNAEAVRSLQLPTHTLMPSDWSALVGDEVEAFHRFATCLGTMNIPFVNTSETVAGVRHAIASGAPMLALHLQGGELTTSSMEARKLLDQSGRRHVKILASGNMDEVSIARLVESESPIDGFVVEPGTLLPPVQSVYKIVAVREADETWEPVIQAHAGIREYPWAKQVFRQVEEDGSFAGDILGQASESLPGERQLRPVMGQGALCERIPSLEESRDYCMMQRIRMPHEVLELTPSRHPYRVRASEHLVKEMQRLVRERAKGAS